MDPVRSRIVPGLLGFFLVANTFLVPGLAASPRATDLIGAALAVWLLVQAHRRGVPAAPLAALGAANMVPLVWLGWGVLEGQSQTAVQAFRWLVAMPWAIALLAIHADAAARARFLWGLVIGCGTGVLVIMGQTAGLDPLLQRLGLSATDAAFHHYVYHQVRIPGIHGHPNASSAVVSLLAPAGLFLYLRHRAPVWLPVGCLLAMLLALHLTSTRSPLVVAVLVVALALLLARDARRALPLAGLLLAGGVLFLAVFGPPGGAVRWGDVLALEANVGERVESNEAALEVAVQHPLGLGVTGGREAMVERGSAVATHNAFLQASVFFGAPLAVMLVLALASHVWRLLTSARSEPFWRGLVALQLAGLFMFEEHLNNPTFVILASWLLAAAVARRGAAAAEAGDQVASPA